MDTGNNIHHRGHLGKINEDRWLELDLYWFDKDNILASVNKFWQRYAPLFKGITGWRGVILNVGWLMDYIYEWRGDLNDSLPLPKSMYQSSCKMEGQLTGNTRERIRKWKRRAKKLVTKKVAYQNWTYGDLKVLAQTLRKVAAEKYAVKDIKVGSLVVGWASIYGGNKSTFTTKHPQVYKGSISVESFGPALNVEGKLNDDPASYAAFPNGIKKGMPIYEFFGAQWGCLSRTVGLNAIVLRDSVIGPGIYRRVGPYGRRAPADPDKVARWSKATTNFVKSTKLGNPTAVVFGYSSAASAVADWRVNCVDLETIAKQGYLDGWIDQTWAGAWNEVGVRNFFWNVPYLGWTYQMANVLLHAAVLADTDVHHYVLTETFDAWEPWDIIHTAPERLKWGMWAYHHAALKTPKGVKMPRGTYISWGNKGKELLSPEDVDLLVNTLNEAVSDAQQTQEVFGPTLVYCRDAMQWQNENAPEQTIKEWIDEQMGTVMKWAIPAFSVTRSEWLPHIKTDLPIIQTPVHLKKEELDYIIKLIKSGCPVAIFGSPAGGIDPMLAKLVGIKTLDKKPGPVELHTAMLVDKSLGYSNGIPNNFSFFSSVTANKVTNDTKVVYSVKNSAALTIALSGGQKVVFWDPAVIEVEDYPKWSDKSLNEWIGSTYPYLLVARVLSDFLKGSNSPYTENIAEDSPVSVGAWQLNDGSYRILAGNIEEGLHYQANQSKHIILNIPGSWRSSNRPLNLYDVWRGNSMGKVSDSLRIHLEQAQCTLYSLK